MIAFIYRNDGKNFWMTTYDSSGEKLTWIDFCEGRIRRGKEARKGKFSIRDAREGSSQPEKLPELQFCCFSQRPLFFLPAHSIACQRDLVRTAPPLPRAQSALFQLTLICWYPIAGRKGEDEMNSQRGEPTSGTEKDRRWNERRLLRHAALQIMQRLLGSGVVTGLAPLSDTRETVSESGLVPGN
jgi:hypothetical protein